MISRCRPRLVHCWTSSKRLQPQLGWRSSCGATKGAHLAAYRCGKHMRWRQALPLPITSPSTRLPAHTLPSLCRRPCAGSCGQAAPLTNPPAHEPCLLLPHCAIRLQRCRGRLCAHCGHHIQHHEAVHRPAPHKNRLQHVPRGQLRRRAGAPTGLAAHNGRGRVAYQPLRGLCTLLAGPLSPARMSAQHVELQVQARLPCVLTWIRPAAAQE